MKQSTYCIVSSIREDSVLFRVMKEVRAVLTANTIPHTLPKMGWCISIISPFFATKIEISWFISGLILGRKSLYSNATPITATSKKMEFFTGKESDALILPIETNPDFRDLIEIIRSRIAHKTDMKISPVKFLANFYGTIAEGRGLAHNIQVATKLSLHIQATEGMSLFSSINPRTTTGLEYPTVLMKTEQGWMPVLE
jgi:hypothetical protein